MSKISNLLATAAVATLGLAGSAAFAQEATYELPLPATSQTTRAQVLAELAQARRDGSINVWSISYNPLAAAKSLKTRAEVQAQVQGAQAQAEMAALIGEDSGSFALSRQALPRDAGRVLAAR